MLDANKINDIKEISKYGKAKGFLVAKRYNLPTYSNYFVLESEEEVQEYANLGVRVNCVLPGPILTELLENSFKSEEQKTKCANRIPMKRIGNPNEVANVVAFLSS